MALESIFISVNETPINRFSRLQIKQSVNSHHSFELVVGHEIIEEVGAHVLEKSKEWIGKPFLTSFGENEFRGIITSVSMNHFHGLNGDLIISGFSPTILLEAKPHMQSWTEKGLKDIVKKLGEDAGLGIKVHPVFEDSIEYVSQYRESHFAFLRRLAATYQEWLYYDGKEIHFGRPAERQTISLAYGPDLDNISISMRMAPLNLSGYEYNAIRDEDLSANSKGEVKGLNDLGNEALASSLESFSIQSNAPASSHIQDKGQLETYLKNKQSALAANLANLTASGTNPSIRPGVNINVHAKIRENGVWKEKPYGEYLVLAITHHISGNHEYKNQFEAIPSGIEYLPEPSVIAPIAESQTGTVLSNNDPEGKGRVQVKMRWQQGDMKTSWIRVMTPDAGTSDKVSSNRGMVTIPEDGDQVMLGFHYNDPSRPFVMGSMFHGKSGGGGGEGNKTKSLSTRSGCTVTLDDSKGSISIKDPSENVITLNGDGTISISAPNKISLNSKEIEIIATDKMHLEGSNTLDLASKVITGTGDDEVHLTSPAAVTIEGKSTSVSGSDSLKHEGKMVDINGSTMTNVKGGTLNLN